MRTPLLRGAPARAECRVGRPRISSATAALSQLLHGGSPLSMLPHRMHCCNTRTTCLHPGRSIARKAGGARPRTKMRCGGCGRRCRSDRSATCDTDHAACDMQHAREACKIRASRKHESKLRAAPQCGARCGPVVQTCASSANHEQPFRTELRPAWTTLATGACPSSVTPVSSLDAQTVLSGRTWSGRTVGTSSIRN
jgi:hypothetical protein